jgi:hypothetical protein
MLASVFSAFSLLVPLPLWGEANGEGKNIRKPLYEEHVRL